jgi:hypothetical protein
VQDPGLNSHSKINCITACIQARARGRAGQAARMAVHAKPLFPALTVAPLHATATLPRVTTGKRGGWPLYQWDALSSRT